MFSQYDLFGWNMNAINEKYHIYKKIEFNNLQALDKLCIAKEIGVM